MRISRLTLSIAATAVLGVATSACGLTSSSDQTGAEAGDEVHPIGYSAVFLQDPAQSAMVHAFREEAKDRGLKLLSPTSANGDSAKQDADIRNLVNAGAKSIFVIPADPQAAAPAIEYAIDQGVRVVTLMLGPDGGTTTVSMQVDNNRIGEQACRSLGEKVNGEGTVLQILGDMRATTAQQRRAGFDACMKSNYPDITVLTKTGGQWEPDKAAQSAAGALSTNPETAGIFMHSDGYIPSVHKVLARNGKDGKATWTVSVDGTPTGLNAIRNGQLDATVNQPVDQFIQYGLDHLQALADGESITPGPTGHDTTIKVTGDGYPADLFPPTLIHADNVDSDTFWANKDR